MIFIREYPIASRSLAVAVFIFVVWFEALGQDNPFNPTQWEVIKSKSDEFNGDVVNTDLWDVLGKEQYPWGWGFCFREEQIILDSGYLHLKVDKKEGYDSACRNCPAPFWSGGIRSRMDNYIYGYYEISAKLPGFYDGDKPDGKGFWPAFWTYFVEVDENRCRIIHDEIDILEPSGTQYADARTNVCGYHDEHPDCDRDHIKIGEGWYTHPDPLFEDFHRYAVEWQPDRITFYFDDVPFFSESNHPSMIMQPQYVVIDQQMHHDVPVNPKMPFPQYMIVDYFRYYRRK